MAFDISFSKTSCQSGQSGFYCHNKYKVKVRWNDYLCRLSQPAFHCLVYSFQSLWHLDLRSVLNRSGRNLLWLCLYCVNVTWSLHYHQETEGRELMICNTGLRCCNVMVCSPYDLQCASCLFFTTLHSTV